MRIVDDAHVGSASDVQHERIFFLGRLLHTGVVSSRVQLTLHVSFQLIQLRHEQLLFGGPKRLTQPAALGSLQTRGRSKTLDRTAQITFCIHRYRPDRFPNEQM